MNITVHIGRLVLDGVAINPSQRQLLQTSLEAELTRLLAQGGIAPSLAQGAALPKLTLNNLQLASNQPGPIGQQIAQTVYGGIGRE